MGLIIKLILAGASRASIIAKHGKKAYNAAKNLMKTKDKSVWSKLSMKDAEKYVPAHDLASSFVSHLTPRHHKQLGPLSV